MSAHLLGHSPRLLLLVLAAFLVVVAIGYFAVASEQAGGCAGPGVKATGPAACAAALGR